MKKYNDAVRGRRGRGQKTGSIGVRSGQEPSKKNHRGRKVRGRLKKRRKVRIQTGGPNCNGER